MYHTRSSRPAWTPLAIGTVTGLTALIGFALPPIAQLRHTPPARVLRRDLGSGHPPAHLIYVAAIATLLVLTSWHAQELWLTLYVVGGSLATTAALALCDWLLVLGLRPLCRRVGIADEPAFDDRQQPLPGDRSPLLKRSPISVPSL